MSALPDLKPLCDCTGRVVLFPVRHHSPAAARLVRDLVHTGAFETLLVEGPPEFNERLAELTAPHTPPIAIY
ncbi:MAG: hypothetical protein ACRCZF_02125, partial [Gemmataceae bacterium]